MVFLEYEINSRYVIEIHDSEPLTITDGSALAKSLQFQVGDEFEYLIKVNEVDHENNAISVSSIKQARSYSRMLKENAELRNNFISADQKYKELDLTTATLEEVKQVKIAQLKELCTLAIYEGFTSTVANVEGIFYEFGFNAHDQDNFDQQLGKINLWYNQLSTAKITQADFDAKFPLDWKAKNIGVIQLSEDEFITVTDDAETHKRTQQAKYWNLETQVLQAITNNDVDLVVW